MTATTIKKLGILMRFMLSLPFLVFPIRAEMLPVKSYSTADGLLRDGAFCVDQDSRGFIWFCTSDGLSRFDGYGFTNYTTYDGLPHRNVYDFLETRDGVYWAATGDGLARFDPNGRRSEAMFASFKPPDNPTAARIETLFEDSRGRLWCGTAGGLYEIESANGQVFFHHFKLPAEATDQWLSVSAIIEDAYGNLVVGMDGGQGLNRISADGTIEHFRVERNKGEPESIKTLLKTADGQIWAGMSINGGACLISPALSANRSIFSRCVTRREGLPSNWVESLFQSSDGWIWMGTANGPAGFDPDTGKVSPYREAQGLCENGINDFLEDRDGNFWIVGNCGIRKIVRSGFVRFGTDDGMASANINGIYASRDAGLFFVTGRNAETADNKNIAYRQINRFDGKRFTFVEPKLPPNVGAGWGGGQIVAQETSGEWWIAGDTSAAYRFPKTNDPQRLASLRPEIIRIPDREVFRVFDDTRGDIWISTQYGARLLRWDRTASRIIDHTAEISADNVVRHANAFAEDRSGTLWISNDDSADLLRYKDGRFSIVGINSDRRISQVNTVFVDSRNRLWIATTLNGVGRVDDLNGDILDVVWYNRQNGLATDGTRGLGEDNFGRIYVGHGRGVDRIDWDTGRIRHFTTADGLPPDLIFNIARDQDGNLWFGGIQGLARLVPEPDKPRGSPNILLTGLRVNGQDQPVSELGANSLPELHLDSGQSQVRIEFLGLGASLGEELKYQYKLQGDWLETTQRAVDFANLAPGSYSFAVRAVSFDGLISQTPASFSFTIAAPVWQRWWFIASGVSILVFLIYCAYRYRVAQLLRVERIRTRLATDLHDDIGANLSKISILSEVARLRMAEGTEDDRQLLGSIAEIARESVSAMSDIVWAINPKRDSILEMTRKMRECAEGSLVPKNVSVEFNSTPDDENAPVPMNLRREIYLIFKEAVNNAAKHSGCSKVTIDFHAHRNEIFLQVNDNGCGFQGGNETNGSGLENMRTRAANLGGTLEIGPAGDSGTSVRLTIPIR